MNILFQKKAHIDRLNNIERKKFIQKIRIVKELYVDGPKTNVEMRKCFSISSPTSTALLNELIEENLVEKKGRAKSEGGRQPDLYGLIDNTFFVVSIAVGRFQTRMAIFSNNNRNLTEIKSFSIPISKDLSAVDDIHSNAEALIEASEIDRKKILAIGLNIPGLVDSKEGNNHTYLKTGDNSQSLQELLNNKFKIPVYLQNDVKSAALAESRFGRARGKMNVLVISLDWGIGLGILMDGQLIRGSTGFAGEIGHIPLENNGILCYCGKRGCLETVASGIALARMAKEGLKNGQDSLLNELSDEEIEKIVPQRVIDAANRGDQYAINILSKIGLNLGKGIAILIQLLNPELIILGGKIANAKEYITTPIQQSINQLCMEQIREKTEISLTTLGSDADLLGSVAVVMEHIFNDMIELDKA